VQWRVGGAQQVEVLVGVCMTCGPWRFKDMELRCLC